jgi:hypothetical protein
MQDDGSYSILVILMGWQPRQDILEAADSVHT